jgi:hypothetical protein
MPNTNGHGPKRAILYARVSTDEQARSGYSLAQQLEALREYAAREGYEVLEGVEGPGQGGASLARPGLDKVRDLVAKGGVSIVLAQDRDRFALEPAYLYLLREEFAEKGTRLKALSDRGDDSPEGQLTAGVPKEDVERARDAIRNNEKCSSAGRRFWELSGGIFRCAQCGRALVAVTTLKGPKRRRRRMFYYICATRRQRGKHACSFSRSMNAQKAEAAVWDAVTALLTDPESLKSDLEAMIEREKETRGDPECEARAWAATLAEAERKREKYQEMYAADAMTLEELRSRLEALEETRESARRELAELASWHERLQALERDKELLLDSYATRAPEALDSLGPEERRTVYSMLGLRVDALSDKSLRISGAFGEESLVCHHDRTSTR